MSLGKLLGKHQTPTPSQNSVQPVSGHVHKQCPVIRKAARRPKYLALNFSRPHRGGLSEDDFEPPKAATSRASPFVASRATLADPHAGSLVYLSITSPLQIRSRTKINPSSTSLHPASSFRSCPLTLNRISYTSSSTRIASSSIPRLPSVDLLTVRPHPLQLLQDTTRIKLRVQQFIPVGQSSSCCGDQSADIQKTWLSV